MTRWGVGYLEHHQNALQSGQFGCSCFGRHDTLSEEREQVPGGDATLLLRRRLGFIILTFL